MQPNKQSRGTRGKESTGTAADSATRAKTATKRKQPRKKSESELDMLARARAASEGMPPPASEVDEAVESPGES